MTFIPCSHMHHMIALKWDTSSTTEKCKFCITGSAWTSSTTSPKEIVKALLNLDSIRTRFSRTNVGNPICLSADIYNRTAKLLGSTKIRLTSKSLIPNVRIRASLWGCNTRLGSTRGKVIIPSIGRMPLLASQVGWS